MSLILEQCFPLGRFHATRWNQNPFEDTFGEWPPSPWRLLRTLVARWFQYARETGDSDETLRNRVLSKLAREVPCFRLPENTWRGPAIHQYYPVGLEEQHKYKKIPGSAKQVPDYSFKQVGTTLVQDHYRVVTPHDPIYWMWNSADMESQEATLLTQLLQRLLYFGRAESYCRFRISAGGLVTPNCRLERTTGTGQPVLVAIPGEELNLESLLAVTNSDLLRQRRIPLGTTWYYARIPTRPTLTLVSKSLERSPSRKNLVQFALGGRVYPPPSHWATVTGRFRGKTLKWLYLGLTNGRVFHYEKLSLDERRMVSLMAGKDANGVRLTQHSHVYFLVWPDEYGQPTRLICWRQEPFTHEEITALLKASETNYSWESGAPEWTVRLVPLPLETVPPKGFLEQSLVWESVTPFVAPTQRHRFRRNGRLRSGETAEALLRKLLKKSGLPEPQSIQLIDHPNDGRWVRVHESRAERRVRRQQRSTAELPGRYYRMVFPEPVPGPLCLGHSSHFGLGLFRPESAR